jgi:lipopolysaccharide export system protein LptC
MMIVRPTSWLPLAVLALLVGLTLWLNQLVQPPTARADGSTRHDPDLMVENFSARKLDPDGSVRYTLAARKMVHYPDDDSAHLDTVKLEAFEPKQPKMTATANRGRLEQGGDRVWIEGNVVVVREPDEQASRLTLTTDRLLVLPDDGIARTSSEVFVESAEGRARSMGIVLDNNARTLQMQQVHATFKAAPRAAAGK